VPLGSWVLQSCLRAPRRDAASNARREMIPRQQEQPPSRTHEAPGVNTQLLTIWWAACRASLRRGDCLSGLIFVCRSYCFRCPLRAVACCGMPLASRSACATT
jgi:hypothetical protein